MSILRNLNAQDLVLYDALCESGPVTVRAIRSRRVPIADPVASGLAFRMPGGGFCALDGERVFEDEVDRALDPFDWISPRQLGRAQAKRERGPHGDGPDWARRTRAAQAKINAYRAKIAAAQASGSLSAIMKAVYSDQQIENLSCISPLLSMIAKR